MCSEREKLPCEDTYDWERTQWKGVSHRRIAPYYTREKACVKHRPAIITLMLMNGGGVVVVVVDLGVLDGAL